MINKKILSLFLIIIFPLFSLKAQVSVVSIQLMPYNVTPDALMSASLNNSGAEQQVQTVSKLYNFNNELLITVRSAPFNVKQGLNVPFLGDRKIASVEYSSSSQSEYIKTTHGLPSGAFKICVDVIQVKTLEVADEFCDDVESDFNQYLYLVFPADKDTIETTSPMLVWSHSEPFSVLSQGEYYRMIVTQIKDHQGAEEAIDINTPVMAKNYLTTHNLQYPYDAEALVEGGHYAWQVQKLANGVVTNKTEAWEFTIRKKPVEKELKYVALKQTVDANFYTAYNGRIYFKFSEEYNSQGDVLALITGDDGKKIPVTISKDEQKSKPDDALKIKAIGDNRFILDLDKEKIKPGFYTLQIKNEKKEFYYLKFYLPQ